MNPFEEDVLLPPGGFQEIGEYGPYYMLDHEHNLIEIPAENVCRDYNFVIASFELGDMKQLSYDGWLNSFESSAIFKRKNIRSRAVVVITSNGWQRGEPTEYTWCIRINFKSGHNETDTPYYKCKFGNKLLWPIPYSYSLKAYQQWQSEGTISTGNLMKIYKPSAYEFNPLGIFGSRTVDAVDFSTVCAIHHIKPSKLMLSDRVDEPRVALPTFKEPSLDYRRPVQPLFFSTIVSTELASRAHRLFSTISFTARDDVAWNILCPDMIDMIFGIIAQECIDSTGEVQSTSFQQWMKLRLICKDSKKSVEQRTMNFMKKTYLIAIDSISARALACTCNTTPLYSVQSAIRLREQLVPRGLTCISFFTQIWSCNKMRKQHDYLWHSIFPYIRLRLGISPSKPLPRRRPKPPPANQAATQEPERRISTRLQSKSQEPGEPHGSDQQQEHVPFKRIRVAMKLDGSGSSNSHVGLAGQPLFPIQEEAAGGFDTWVQCEQCSEWRILPHNFPSDNLPEVWDCSMHPLETYACVASNRSLQRRTRRKVS